MMIIKLLGKCIPISFHLRSNSFDTIHNTYATYINVMEACVLRMTRKYRIMKFAIGLTC